MSVEVETAGSRPHEWGLMSAHGRPLKETPSHSVSRQKRTTRHQINSSLSHSQDHARRVPRAARIQPDEDERALSSSWYMACYHLHQTTTLWKRIRHAYAATFKRRFRHAASGRGCQDANAQVDLRPRNLAKKSNRLRMRQSEGGGVP